MLFDISRIVKDNYTLLIKDSSKIEVFTYLFFIPIIISLVFVVCGFKLNDSQFTDIITFIAIIVGFLINITVVLISTQNTKGVIGEFLKNRNKANIFYTILVGISITLLSIIKPCFENFIFHSILNSYLWIASPIYYVILYSLFIHFIFMILIIIKAFYALYI